MTDQQRDLSLSHDVKDVVVPLALLVQLRGRSSRHPGFGGVLPGHGAPGLGKHQPRAPGLHSGPRDVRVNTG